MLTTVLVMPLLVGVLALAVDAGFMFDYRRRAQIAADAGAAAAAMQLFAQAGSTQTDLETTARADTALNSFTHGTNGITVAVNRPPTMGYYAGNAAFVEVVVTRPTPTFFMRMWGWTSMNVGASAVAGPGGSRGCIYILTTEAGKGLWVTGTATINATNCEVFVNSDMLVDNGACINADTINITRSRMGGGCYNATVITGAPITPDPLNHLTFPTATGCTGELLIGNGTTVANPGCYDKIIVENIMQTVTFNPGEYHALNGVFLKNGTTVVGTGVTFFLHNDKFELAGSATLAAPTTGPWAAMLVFMNKTLDKDIELKNDSIANLDGTLYTKSGKILYSGTTSGTAAYTILVAKEMLYSGIGHLNNNFAALPGGSPFKKPSIAD